MLSIDLPVGLDLDVNIRNLLYDTSDRASNLIAGKVRYIYNDNNKEKFDKAKNELSSNNIKFDTDKW